MPSVPIPEFTGKWKDRIAELLKEAEDLSLRELEREKILAEAFNTISGFFQELKTEKYEEELRKDYIDAKTKDVFAPYFKKICGASERIKNILGYIKKSNEEISKNSVKLAYLVKEHNNSMWHLIKEDKREIYLQFQAICYERYKKCKVINTSLDYVSGFIESMEKIAKEASSKDIKKFDTRRVVEYLNSEKQIFLEAAKAQLKELGFESSSMKDITELEELIQVISNSRLFDEKRRKKKWHQLEGGFKKDNFGLCVYFHSLCWRFPNGAAGIFHQPEHGKKTSCGNPP